MSTDRPSWMEGGTPKARQPRPPSPSVSAARPNVRYMEESQPVATTHRNVVVGITILAAMALLSTFFWIGFLVSVLISPLTFGANWGIGRMLFCAIVSIGGSIATWRAVDSMVD